MQELRYLDNGYRHVDKVATPRERVEAVGTRLKWYDLARAETPVPATIRRMAREDVGAVLDSDETPHNGELGFVILHRCGTEFYFLMLCTWRGSNEIWETVFAKANDATPRFSLFPREATHKPTFCVWEMGIVWHETQAWARFLKSPRGVADQNAYLFSAFEGIV